MKKRLSLILAVLMTAVILAGCSKSAAYDSAGNSFAYAPAAQSAKTNSKADFGYASESYDMASADSPQDMSGSSDYSPATGTDVAPQNTGRKLIRRVNLNIESLEFDQSVRTIESYIGSFGGYIESSSITNSNYYYSYNYSSRSARIANYVLRIPSEMLDGFLGQVGNIGNITSQSSSSEDITLSYIDLEARTESLEIQQERLLALLEKAETVDEIISLEDRLSVVRYQIESQRSTLKNYDNLVAYSTVSITLAEVVKITEPEPTTMGERISRGLSDTFYDLGIALEDFAVGFVVNLPYILLWAVIIFVIVFIIVKIVKGSKKRREKKQAKLQAKLQADWAARQAANSQPQAPANDNQTTDR